VRTHVQYAVGQYSIKFNCYRDEDNVVWVVVLMSFRLFPFHVCIRFRFVFYNCESTNGEAAAAAFDSLLVGDATAEMSFFKDARLGYASAYSKSKCLADCRDN